MGIVGMGIVVPRSEAREVEEASGWVLVFGRRKTGKTFLLKNFVRHDYYFFVSRGGEVFESSDGGVRSLYYSVFLERLRALLERDVTVVVDEFQRLPEDFLDFLHFAKSWSRARVVLVGSSLLVSRKVFSRRSPLLGLVVPVRVGLVRPVDVVAALSRRFDPFRSLVFSSLVRDPWILGLVELGGGVREFVGRVVGAIRFSCRGLVGEIFLEEERELTERYEAVLRALADGFSTPSLVANYVSNVLGGRFKSQDVKKYLSNLLEMGVVERRRVYGKKRYIYGIESPLLDLFYFLDVRLGFYEVDLPRNLVVSKALERLPFYYEKLVVDLLAQILGARAEKALRPELDGVLVRGNRVVAVVEVKFGDAKREDVYRFLAKTERFRCKKMFVSRSELGIGGVEYITPEGLVELVREYSSKQATST